MESGLVYVLTNAAMPGIVKIGITTRQNIENRLRELFTTSVPVPFKCEFACQVDDCNKVESALHRAFHPYRFPKREFFKIDPGQAIAILELFEKKDITAEISHEINEHTTPEERSAGERLERQKRPPLNYVEMKIPIGATLHFTESADNVVAEVAEPRKVRYHGKLISLTRLTMDLLKIDHAVQPTGYWTYNGRNLKDIYNETYSDEVDDAE
jgi:hypothetical protein